MMVIKYVLLFELLFLALIAIKRNSDLFSAVKIYLVVTMFFNLAIFFRDIKVETLICFATLVQFIAVCVFFEKKICPVNISASNYNRIYKLVWLASVPGISVMIYFIYDAGGLAEYISALYTRVSEWRGRGYLTVLFNMIPTLNLIYFASIIANKKRKPVDIVFFIVFFNIFVTIGLLTASRSYIAVTLLGMILVWSYIIKPIKISMLVWFATFIILISGLIGGLRNNEYSLSELNFQTLSEVYENEQTAYGINPLEIIFESDEKVVLGGLSYVTLFTNFIPRIIWQDKPDTAGIIFTKLYTDDQTGLSYIATGAVAEAVLNFGKSFGPIIGLIINFIVLVFGCVYYSRNFTQRIISKNKKKLTIFTLVSYFYITLSFARFSYGEFTDIFQSLLFFNLLPLIIVSYFSRINLKSN
jgi:hypothetical protein